MKIPSLLLTAGLALGAATASLQAQTIIDSEGTGYDGTQSTITGPTFAANADFAITFWYKTTEESDRDFFQLIFTGGGNVSFRLDEMTIAPNSGDWFPESDGSNIWARFREGDYPPGDIINSADNAWHQFALVYDYDAGNSNGVASLYFDGGLLATKGPDNFSGTSATITMFDGGKAPFVGDFSDTAVYEGSILTATDVDTLFNAGAGTVVIPEPSTFVLLAGALGLGIVMTRRRRS